MKSKTKKEKGEKKMKHIKCYMKMKEKEGTTKKKTKKLNAKTTKNEKKLISRKPKSENFVKRKV